MRVSYVGDTILRLDIENDAVANKEQRNLFSAAARVEAQKRMQQNPVTRHMNLGFGIAMLFMTGWWNLQWRRFMKFWIKKSYKPTVILLFRGFLAANLVGAIWNLIQQVVGAGLSRSDFLAGIEIGVGVSGTIWLMVNILERVNRRAV